MSAGATICWWPVRRRVSRSRTNTWRCWWPRPHSWWHSSVSDLRAMTRLIDYAGDVASGNQDKPTPPSEGSTDLKELREALVIMVEALQERIAFETKNAEAMQQFIDDASHELRTPLTVVKGYNELLASGTASAELQARAVTRVQREVERMEELVRDLLLLAVLREAPHHAPQRV